jgi:hypothetical protein
MICAMYLHYYVSKVHKHCTWILLGVCEVWECTVGSAYGQQQPNNSSDLQKFAEIGHKIAVAVTRSL